MLPLLRPTTLLHGAAAVDSRPRPHADTVWSTPAQIPSTRCRKRQSKSNRHCRSAEPFFLSDFWCTGWLDTLIGQAVIGPLPWSSDFVVTRCWRVGLQLVGAIGTQRRPKCQTPNACGSALAGLRPLAGAKVSWVQQLALVASRHVLQLKWRGHRTLNRGSGSLVQTLSPELMPPHTLSAGSAGGWRSGDQVDQIARSGLYSSSMKRTRGALRG